MSEKAKLAHDAFTFSLGGMRAINSFVVAPGSNSAPAGLTLGVWSSEVPWRPASLAGWAVDGGIAPIAVLGSNILEVWSLHWYPASYQFRLDGPASSP